MPLGSSDRVPCTWRAAAFALAAVVIASAMPAAAQTLDRVKQAGTIKLGYRADARPFSFQNDAGKPDGYAVSLCTVVVDALKEQLQLSDLRLEWVPLEMDQRFEAVQSGAVDLFCSASSVTLGRREVVSFSIPIFASGTGGVVRTDAPLSLREVLEQGQPADRPIWRGSPARTVLERKTFAAVAGTTSEAWLKERVKTFKLDATVATVGSYEEGINEVRDGGADVFFGDLPILLDAVARSEDSGDLLVLRRQFTFEPLAIALAREDEDLRLAVDRALSRFYRSEEFPDVFAEWFGAPDETFVTFLRQNTLPE